MDCSKDDSEEWINQKIAGNPRIKALPQGVHFGGAARNLFRILHKVDFSEFDYISLADQDDIGLPDKLWRAHELLCRTGADAYSSNVAFWPDGHKVLIKKSQPQVKWDFLFEAAGPGCTYVMKRELVRAMQDLLTDVTQSAADRLDE